MSFVARTRNPHGGGGGVVVNIMDFTGRSTFFRTEVYIAVGISQGEIKKRLGKTFI